MPRPARYDTDLLLDAALDLVAVRGPAGLSMTGLAKATGAPSGSVYHRFPHRAALLGELWVRTTARFQEGFLECLATVDARQAAVRAARHVVAWSSANPAEARVLLHGRREFAAGDWPDPVTERSAAQDRQLRAALRDVMDRLDADREQVLIAIVDLPYAIVRRHLTGDGEIPATAANLAAAGAGALLDLKVRE